MFKFKNCALIVVFKKSCSKFITIRITINIKIYYYFFISIPKEMTCGRKEGRKEGRREGKKEGRKKGRKEERKKEREKLFLREVL